jgi:hypothetical protein
MAITNPEAVQFSNQFVRVFADSLVTAYDTAAAYKAYWDARSNLSALFPNSAAEIVADGADVDGRPAMNGAKVQALYTQAVSVIAWGDTVVSGQTRITWLRQMAVNGKSRVPST